MIKRMHNLSGMRFNKLIVQNNYKIMGTKKTKSVYWECLCDCGKFVFVRANSLKRNHTKSCGCIKKEIGLRSLGIPPTNKTHGCSHNRTYTTWKSMLQRVKGTAGRKVNRYYFNRKIGVDPKWFKFENFLKDMGERPTNKSIDRINNNLGYFKANCRWATAKEQANNRRKPKRIKWDKK